MAKWGPTKFGGKTQCPRNVAFTKGIIRRGTPSVGRQPQGKNPPKRKKGKKRVVTQIAPGDRRPNLGAHPGLPTPLKAHNPKYGVGDQCQGRRILSSSYSCWKASTRESIWLATERICLPLLKPMAPDLIDYYMPENGVFHNLILAKMKLYIEDHANRLACLLGLGRWTFGKNMHFW